MRMANVFACPNACAYVCTNTDTCVCARIRRIQVNPACVYVYALHRGDRFLVVTVGQMLKGVLGVRDLLDADGLETLNPKP